MRRLRVLVVDDNRDAAEMLATLVELSGHESHVAVDGATAIAKAAELCPDVAFVDLGMPSVSGYQVARAMRGDARLSGVFLVAFSGWGPEEVGADARAAGFERHLMKPVDPEVIARLLDERSRS